MPRLVRWIVAAVVAAAALGALAAWRTGIAGIPRETGYFSPVFAPDGQSVLVVTRDVRAIVTGFGREFFTPPATVRSLHDRFALIRVAVANGNTTVVETFPPSPLEGSRIQSYHGAIFGSAHVHLRWADAEHLDYEIAVTRHDTPLSRTFVIRRAWNPQAASYTTTAPWQEGFTGMAGDEPAQLHGDLEVIAMPGDEGLPCGVALLRRGEPAGHALVETGTCRAKYASRPSAAVLAPLSRRADIERSETINKTYAELVERGRRSGVPEGQAMLDANEEMSRLGFFPKSTKLVALRAECAGASPLFEISDEEFNVGLFPDIERAVAAPGGEVNKSMGAYITHRDYATSRQLNAFIDAGHSSFFVRARGGCWRLTITKP